MTRSTASSDNSNKSIWFILLLSLFVLVTKAAEIVQQETSQQTTKPIIVRSATYRPPFSQYGAKVAIKLDSVPSSQMPNLGFNFANWVLELALAHKEQAEYDYRNDEMKRREEFELALNAYLEGIDAHQEAFQKHPQLSSRDDVDMSIASIYFNMGVLYLGQAEIDSDPESTRQTAMENFRQALEMYNQLLESGVITSSGVSDVQLKWADTATKISSLLLSTATSPKMGTFSLELGDIDVDDISNINFESILSFQTDFEEKLNKALTESKELLQQSISIYHEFLEHPPLAVDDNESERLFNILNLSDALQTAVTVTTMQENLLLAKDYSLEALQLLKDLLTENEQQQQQQHMKPSDISNAQTSIASLHVGLSNIYLQLGNYAQAKSHYRQGLDAYQEYKIDMTSIIPTPSPDTEETVSFITEALAMTSGGGSFMQSQTQVIYPEGNPGGAGNEYFQQFFFPQDDAYEGDLRNALATAYLASGQIDLALEQFELALELYTTATTLSSKSAIASTKVSYSMALYQNGEFDKSYQIYCEGLDKYHELYGDGVNPLAQELDDLESMLGALGGDGGGASDILSSFFDMSVLNNDNNDNFDNDEDNDDDDNNNNEMKQEKYHESVSRKNAKGGADKKKKSPPQVHENLINLDQYKDILLNATVVNKAINDEL